MKQVVAWRLKDDMSFRWITSVLTLCLLFAVGCAESTQRAVVSGSVPTAATKVTISPWSFESYTGKTVSTRHYNINTTIEDSEVINNLVQVMEGAFLQYQALTPGVPETSKPMECFIFARRPQWAAFTKARTGPDSRTYLQINRGGYTIRDWYVAYYIGDVGTYSVAAHEGWHQYVARNFHSRLPPFLEEGLATTFENITWPNGLPRWNTTINYNRADKLKTAIEGDMLWPIDKLCTMHAGDVVGLSGDRIETFYAQSWAFAQFMLNADNGRYKSAFHRMMRDLATGASDQWTGQRQGPPDSWNPNTVRPLLEHYLGMNIGQIDTAYVTYIRQLSSVRGPARSK